MGIFKGAVAASAILAIVGSPVFAASQPVRPSMAVSASGTRLALPAPSAVNRAGARVGQQNDLLGAPLFLAFLGAVVITIGTIIIINNNDGPNSP